MGVSNTEIDNVLNSIFPTGPNKYYVGLINNSPSPLLSPSDTLNSHTGWSEAAGGGTVYSGNRPLWTNGASVSRVVTNSSAVTFNIVAAVSGGIYGIFLTDQASGNVGTLFGTFPFPSVTAALSNLDVLNITFNFHGASS